jgi:hypothetical protein
MPDLTLADASSPVLPSDVATMLRLRSDYGVTGSHSGPEVRLWEVVSALGLDSGRITIYAETDPLPTSAADSTFSSSKRTPCPSGQITLRHTSTPVALTPLNPAPYSS